MIVFTIVFGRVAKVSSDGIPYALSVAMHWLLETMRQLARLFTDLELGEDFCALERRLSEQSQSYREAFAGVLE